MNKDDLLFKGSDKLGVISGNVTTYSSTITTVDDSNQTIQRVYVPEGYAATIRVQITAIQTGGSAGTVGDTADFLDIVMLMKTITLATVVGGTSFPVMPTYNDAGASTWFIDTQIPNPSDYIDFQVTGEPDKTIDWTCKTEVQLVK